MSEINRLAKYKQTQRKLTHQNSLIVLAVMSFVAISLFLGRYFLYPGAPHDHVTTETPVAATHHIRVETPVQLTASNKLNSSAIVHNSAPITLPKKPRIAFAITITKDGSFQDGAAVLAYSILSTTSSKGYDISLIAFVHPNVSLSRPYLSRLGYHVIEAPTPINTSAIRYDFLREKIDKNGCCGAAELIKLNSYRLGQYQKVIHLDADTFILNSLLYTTDPNMASYKKPECMPVQGGFIVLSPSEQDYCNLINIMMTTEFRKGKGWNSSHIGWFWGGMTVQGVLPYYYNKVTAPGRSTILDRCLYNTMADTEECMVQSLDQIRSAHFTVCQKPWMCYRAFVNDLCGQLHKRWFETRLKAEAFYGLTPEPRACPKGHGSYIHMKLHDARLPVGAGLVPDDSPDFLPPIGNTGYLSTHYH